MCTRPLLPGDLSSPPWIPCVMFRGHFSSRICSFLGGVSCIKTCVNNNPRTFPKTSQRTSKGLKEEGLSISNQYFKLSTESSFTVFVACVNISYLLSYSMIQMLKRLHKQCFFSPITRNVCANFYLLGNVKKFILKWK